ncbi:MAG: hypothetical protein E7483_02470 [Ruminococcaceae bacterium]|nr:hypothetical protein [Oscillospiraceae bacterium]
MTLGDIAKKYYMEQGLNCAVSVLLAASDKYGAELTKEDAKLVTGFGGGIGCGDLCGCLGGAVAALGKIMLPQNVMHSPEFKEICAGFVAEFKSQWGTTQCEIIKAENATETMRCGDVVKASGDLLESYIEKYKS